MKVLIADKFEQFGIDELRRVGCDVVYEPGRKGPELAETIRQSACDVLIVRSTKVSRDVLEACRSVRLILRAGAGVDTIDVTAATERGIRVCNCPGMNSVAVAELTVGLMIALDRRIVDETDDLRAGVWKKKEYSKALGLKGRTLGIVGLGRIGAEVAKRAAAFDMKLIYSDTISRKDLEAELGVHKVPMDQLLAESDFITLHVPGGPTTRYLIGDAQLRKMKPTAYLINCSRGGVIDEQALAEALKAGRLAGAALDVWEIEPEAPEGEFKDPASKAPRLYGTHHVGASTEQAQLAVAEETVRIVRTFLRSGKILNCVNPA